MEEDLGGRRDPLSGGVPSPSKPPSSSPNFPQPGVFYSASELSVLRNETRCGGREGTPPAQESFLDDLGGSGSIIRAAIALHEWAAAALFARRANIRWRVSIRCCVVRLSLCSMVGLGMPFRYTPRETIKASRKIILRLQTAGNEHVIFFRFLRKKHGFVRFFSQNPLTNGKKFDIIGKSTEKSVCWHGSVGRARHW